MEEQEKKQLNEDILFESVSTTFKQFGLFNSAASIIAALIVSALTYHISGNLSWPLTWLAINTLVTQVSEFNFHTKESITN